MYPFMWVNFKGLYPIAYVIYTCIVRIIGLAIMWHSSGAFPFFVLEEIFNVVNRTDFINIYVM